MNKLCPFLKEPCIEHGCMLWKDIIFNSPEGPTSKWDCSIRWLVPLTIEVAKETRQAAASDDKKATEFRMAVAQLLMVPHLQKSKSLEAKDEDSSAG